jgi:hypothetical protein
MWWGEEDQRNQGDNWQLALLAGKETKLLVVEILYLYMISSFKLKSQQQQVKIMLGLAAAAQGQTCIYPS